MRKITLTLMSLFLTMGAMAQFGYKAGERKSTFADGDKVILFSTCMVNGTERDFTAIFKHGESNAALENAKPYASYVNDGSSVWVVKVLEGSTDEQPKLAFKPLGKETYWGIGGLVNNTEIGDNQTYTLVNYANWMPNNTAIIEGKDAVWCGNDVWALNANFEPIKPSDVTSDDKLFVVVAGNGQALNTNGKNYAAATAAYPIALYEAIEINYAPTSTGQKDGDGRYIKTFGINNDTYSLTEAEKNQKYVDKTASKTFIVPAGSDVKAVMTSDQSWMHAYVYVDADENGFTAGVADNDGYTPTGDLVSYSFYNGGTNVESGWNSAGVELTGGYRSTLELPEFKAPSKPGVYRLRAKYDWNSIDPKTSVQSDGTPNGNLAIIDFTLKVVNKEYYTVLNNLGEVEGDLNNNSFEKVALTTEEGQDGYIWANSTASNSQEGKDVSVGKLIDGIVGDANNYFHSGYQGTLGTDPYHYIEIDLGDNNEIQNFFFDYTTRANSQALANIPTTIEVFGSNDKQSYSTIKTFTTAKDGLPNANNKFYKSVAVNTTEPYRYLRFRMDGGSKFFHLAEFNLYKIKDTELYNLANKVTAEKNILGNMDLKNSAVEEMPAKLLNGKLLLKFNEVIKTLHNSGYVTKKVALTTDADKPGRIWTNAQSGEEGPIKNLIDGNTNTYFHSAYSGEALTPNVGFHFFEIDLGDGNAIKNFVFDYHTRHDAQSHFPKKIVVLGSKDGNNYFKVTQYDEGLREAANVKVETEAFLGNEAYRYLRFAINSSAIFFHMAEFNLYDITINDEYRNRLNSIYKLLECKSKIDSYATLSNSAKEELLAEMDFALLLPVDEYYKLPKLIDEIDSKEYTAGEGFGAIEGTSLEELTNLLGTAKYLSENYVAEADYAELYATLKNTYKNLKRNGGNKYYRLQNKASEWYASSDLRSGEANNNNKLYMRESGETSSTIWYLTNNSELLSYAKGQFMGDMSSDWSFEAIGNPGNLAVFTKYGDFYTVSPSGNRNLYGDDVRVDAAGTDQTGNNYLWKFIEVDYLPVTITSAGYASFYAPVNVKATTNVKAYVINSINDNGKVELLEIRGGVIPANTGVILSGVAGTYNLEITNEGADVDDLEIISKNWLKGTVETTFVSESAYVLSMLGGEVGLYKATLNKDYNAAFQNNSHKAYLPAKAIPATANLSAGFRFDFGGTTAIEEVKTETTETVIYDLTGRRVNEITKAGVYIVNGKKVLVK